MAGDEQPRRLAYQESLESAAEPGDPAGGPLPSADRLRGPQEIGPDLPPASYLEYQDGPWLRTFLRPLLIALVATALAAGPLAMLRAFTTSRLSFALPLLFLAAAGGVYSTLQRGRPRWRDRRGVASRVGELVGLIVLLRLAEWTFATGFPAARTLVGWVHDPILFFDDQFVFLALVVMLSWGFAVLMTVDFLDLALQADEFAAQQPRKWDESASAIRAGQPVARSEVLHGFVRRWAWGGMFLVFTAAVTRVTIGSDANEILQVGVLSAGLELEVILALVIYFLGGFLLFSQGRLAVLRAGWFNQGIPVAPPLLRRWHITGLVSVLVVGVLAALLPLGSTLGLARVLEILLGLAMRFFYLLFALLLVLFGLLLYPLRGLFGQNTQAPPPKIDLSQLQRPPPAANLLPAWLPGLLFWLVAAIVITYLVVAYLRVQGPLGRQGDRWLGLIYWWRARWQRVRRAVQAARARAQLRFRRLRRAGEGARRAREPKPGTLTPRGQVRYFYLSTLRRAAEQGIMRPPERTPLEFVRDLRAQWPEAEADLEVLTDAFVEARYDSRPIVSEQVQGVQAVWRRAMRALGRRAG